MPFLELIALVLAASTWGHLWSGKRIRFIGDCVPVVEAVNKRYSKINRMMGPIRHLCTLAAHHQFDFDCRWIAGVTNVAADLLSRGQIDSFLIEVPTAQRAPSALVPLPPFDAM